MVPPSPPNPPPNPPKKDPATFFEDPDYRAYGNLFWPDFWAVVDKKDLVFDIVGLDYEKATVGLIDGCWLGVYAAMMVE